MLLFVWLIVKCFKAVGRGIGGAEGGARARFLIWSLGCGLMAHVASFFSVSYFDQITIFWYLLIGMLAALATENTNALPDRAAGLREVSARKPRFAHFHARTPAGFR